MLLHPSRLLCACAIGTSLVLGCSADITTSEGENIGTNSYSSSMNHASAKSFAEKKGFTWVEIQSHFGTLGGTTFDYARTQIRQPDKFLGAVGSMLNGNEARPLDGELVYLTALVAAGEKQPRIATLLGTTPTQINAKLRSTAAALGLQVARGTKYDSIVHDVRLRLAQIGLPLKNATTAERGVMPQ